MTQSQQQAETSGALGAGADVDAVAQRVLDASLAFVDAMAIYVGDRLGWYRSLRDDGPATAGELADRTATSPRYAREWLEQQAVTGLLDVDVPEQRAGVPAQRAGAQGEDGDERRFRLPPAAAEVLTDTASLNYLAPLPRMLLSSAVQMPALLEAYRSGSGVSWDQLGTDARESQADMNRPVFESSLGPALAGVPALHDRLSQPGARLADVGCGAGWSSIALARAYPQATVDGYDIDGPALQMARSNARDAGIDDRVRFSEADAAQLPEGAYDVAFAFECVHDMPRPVEVLSAMRRAQAPGGTVVVMDEAVAEEFTAPGDDVERLMYGFSLFVCLPDGMSSPPSAGTGTVLRPATLEAYARQAGFSGLDVLPISDFGFFRFYELV